MKQTPTNKEVAEEERPLTRQKKKSGPSDVLTRRGFVVFKFFSREIWSNSDCDFFTVFLRSYRNRLVSK